MNGRFDDTRFVATTHMPRQRKIAVSARAKKPLYASSAQCELSRRAANASFMKRSSQRGRRPPAQERLHEMAKVRFLFHHASATGVEMFRLTQRKVVLLQRPTRNSPKRRSHQVQRIWGGENGFG